MRLASPAETLGRHEHTRSAMAAGHVVPQQASVIFGNAGEALPDDVDLRGGTKGI